MMSMGPLDDSMPVSFYQVGFLVPGPTKVKLEPSRTEKSADEAVHGSLVTKVYGP